MGLIKVLADIFKKIGIDIENLRYELNELTSVQDRDNRDIRSTLSQQNYSIAEIRQMAQNGSYGDNEVVVKNLRGQILFKARGVQ